MKVHHLSLAGALLSALVSPAWGGSVQYQLTAQLGQVQYDSPAQESRFGGLVGSLSGGTVEVRYQFNDHALDWVDGFDWRSLVGRGIDVPAVHTQVTFYDAAGLAQLNFAAQGSFYFTSYATSYRVLLLDYPRIGEHFSLRANPIARNIPTNHGILLYNSSAFFFDSYYSSLIGQNAAFFNLEPLATWEVTYLVPMPTVMSSGIALLSLWLLAARRHHTVG